MDFNVYLTFDGTCEDALNFYADTLGGEILMLSHFNEMPEGDFKPPPGSENRVLHARMMLGGKLVMASDSFPGQTVTHGGFSMQTGWDSVEEAEAIFAKLSEGGSISMPFGPTFWAKAFGTCKDKFGVDWMVNVDREDWTQT